MDAKMKDHWLSISVILVGLAVLIGLVAQQLSPGPLCTACELSLVGMGFGGIFVWMSWLA